MVWGWGRIFIPNQGKDHMKREKHRSKSLNETVLVIIGIILFVVAAILLLCFLLKGETKTTGEWTGVRTTESLSCKANNLPYPVYETSSILNSTTQINATFDNDKIGSISLMRKTNYASAEIAKVENDALTAAMNMDFGKNDMKAFALDATFSVDDNTAQMSLYANQSDLNKKSVKYFMLDNLPSKIDDYQEVSNVKQQNSFI